MKRLAAFLSLLAACTSSPAPENGRSSATRAPPISASPSPAASAEVVLSVVATLSGPTAATDRSFLDGMRLGEREINREGGVNGARLRLVPADDRGSAQTAEALVAEALTAPAVLVVGPGEGVTANRTLIERAGRPVFLLGGDLYSTRELFRWTFQSSVPVRWQARVTGRYLARDREYDRVLVVATSASAAEVAEEELRAEGVGVVATTLERDTAAIADEAATADAVLALISPPTALRLAADLSRLPDPPQLAVTSESLGRSGFPPGTVAPYLYSWSGWAEPIPRVARFRDHFERRFDRLPSGLEQEGYDAVRLLAAALERTEDASGVPLLQALERNRPDGPTHSSLPLTLGPDDHTTIDETWVGLFAVPGPDEPNDPWLPSWRPIIRTFTYDGERTVFFEPDRRVFFPFWRHGRPSPKYFRSTYGVTTRPSADPLH